MTKLLRWKTKFVASALTPNQKSALERARRNVDLRQFLFAKASGVQWFDAFKEAGFLRPEDIPAPVAAKEKGYFSIPPWPITQYLVATSAELEREENERYAVEILDFIRKAAAYAKAQGFSNYRVTWQFSKVLTHIPPQLIQVADMSMIDHWLNDAFSPGTVAETLGKEWLTVLLDRNDKHANALAMELLKSLYKTTPDANGEDRLRYDAWHAKQITNAVGAKAGRVLGKDAVVLLQDRLEQLLAKNGKDRWSAVGRRAIEDHEQNYSAGDTDDILIEGLREILLGYTSGFPDERVGVVRALLASKYWTTKRIATYVVAKNYASVSDVVPDVLAPENFSSNMRHELWHFLHEHYPHLGNVERARVREIIGQLVAEDENGQVSQTATAYKHALWLAAIKDYGEDVDRLYRDATRLIGGDPEHPDFSSYSTTEWGGRPSPIPKEDLLSMDVEGLVEVLSNYKDPARSREPGVSELARELRQAVKTEPLRFHSRLALFMHSDVSYIHEVIEAYRELWNEKVQLPWNDVWRNLLTFCQDLVRSEQFWNINDEQQRPMSANRHWVVTAIARLIEDGTKMDENSFDPALLEQAESILKVLLAREPGEEFDPDTDAVSLAINSSRGQCLEALINLSLRACRLADRESNNHTEVWRRFQPTYESELSRANDGEYEFATLVTNYLLNFLYMSERWVLENLGRIFDHENYQKWLCAMQGYGYVNRVHADIYEYLKKNDHFIRALDDGNLKERVSEKIVQNIAVTYLNGRENLNDEASLIRTLLSRKHVSELSQLVWFFWTLRKEPDDDLRGKIYDLWSRLIAAIDLSDSEGHKMASKLCDWSVYVAEIDDTTRPLMLAVAPFATVGYNSHELLQSIAVISEKQPFEAYIIWRRMLENGHPDFPQDAIAKLLSNLLKAGAEGKRKAKDIVDQYVRVGNELPLKMLAEAISRHA